MKEQIHRRTDCRLCHRSNFKSVLDLGTSALANEFVSDPSKEQTQYPLELFQCQDCGHFQLLDVVDPEIMFSNYLYVSGTSLVMRNHFKDYADSVIEQYRLQPSDLVVDIGSNDGTLLKYFQTQGIKAIGIEPAKNLADQCNANGILTVNNFFTPKVAKIFASQLGKAKICIMNNCFAHIDNLNEIVEGVKHLLTPDGTFIFEVSYFGDVIKSKDFSQLYHEHVSFHDCTSLQSFLMRHGLHISSVERLNIHGGSIRVATKYWTKDQPWKIEEGFFTFLDCLKEEMNIFLKLDQNQLQQEFTGPIQQLKSFLKPELLRLKAQGKTIAGVLASAKSTTFLHYCDIGPEILDFIADDAPEKQGKFSPGKHIPILPMSAIYEKNPDYLLVLSYNFAESIIKMHPNFKGKWVIPFPTYEVRG